MSAKKTSPGKVMIKRSTAGLGLFATRPFKKGDRIVEYKGRVISKDEEYSSRSKYLFEVRRGRTIDGASRRNLARYINHACKPNCEPEIEQGRVFIDAIKNIAEGEELGYDYGKEYVDEHIKPLGCRCAKCRA